MIPAMVVTLAMGRSGIDQLLVASQVVLSIVLPFIMLPLLWLTTSKDIMSVKKPELVSTTLPTDGSSNHDMSTASKHATPKTGHLTEHDDVEALPSYEIVDYSNGKIVASIGYIVWVLVIVANLYVIVMLAMGKSG
jgi:metal iron transporter